MVSWHTNLSEEIHRSFFEVVSSHGIDLWWVYLHVKRWCHVQKSCWRIYSQGFSWLYWQYWLHTHWVGSMSLPTFCHPLRKLVCYARTSVSTALQAVRWTREIRCKSRPFGPTTSTYQNYLLRHPLGHSCQQTVDTGINGVMLVGIGSNMGLGNGRSVVTWQHGWWLNSMNHWREISNVGVNTKSCVSMQKHMQKQAPKFAMEPDTAFETSYA